MKAIETTATVYAQGQLTLDRPLDIAISQRVRVIILIEDEDTDFDNIPTDGVAED